MLEIAIGDAYGACFEGAVPIFVQRNNEADDMTYTNHPRKLRKRPEDYNPSLVPTGGYTDDTQMAIAIAEAMIDDDDWTKESLADRFVHCFHRDERRGYTPYFLHVLLNSRNGREMMSKINGKSTKSGGAMRAGPIGLYPDKETVVRRARIQAAITHNSWQGQNSAVCAALMTHYFYYDLGPKAELCDWLRDEYFADTLHSDDPFEADGEYVQCWKPGRRVRVHGWDCIEAAIYAIESSDSLSKILWQCVAYTGDVDTVAAIAMGPASVSKEIEQDLPDTLIEGLENRKYGRDYLRALDSKLLALFPRPTKETANAVEGREEVQGSVQAEGAWADDGLATAGDEGALLGLDSGAGDSFDDPLEDVRDSGSPEESGE